MSRDLNKILMYLLLLIIMVTAIGFAIRSGAKAELLEQTVVDNKKEIETLNKDLKDHKALMYERDVTLDKKDKAIESLIYQKEEMMRRLPGGSQDE